MIDSKSIQETYASENACFGCGPANPKGLHVRSFVEGDRVIALWKPEKHHEAFPGVLAGGIVGTLLDCHSNWTAAYHLMQKAGAASPPCTVTADYDPRMLGGALFGKLGAAPEPKAFYAEMAESPAFKAPIHWNAIEVQGYDAILLPGGHAPGMRQYLGSPLLQQKVAAFWKTRR